MANVREASLHLREDSQSISAFVIGALISGQTVVLQMHISQSWKAFLASFFFQNLLLLFSTLQPISHRLLLASHCSTAIFMTDVQANDIPRFHLSRFLQLGPTIPPTPSQQMFTQ